MADISGNLVLFDMAGRRGYFCDIFLFLISTRRVYVLSFGVFVFLRAV